MSSAFFGIFDPRHRADVHIAAPLISASTMRSAMTRWLDRLTFVLLFVAALATAVTPKALALAIPAVLVWVAKLLLGGRRLRGSPLVMPMLALLAAAALASCFAYDPAASWARVRIFAALLLAILIGDTATSAARIKTLTYALIVSAVTAVGWATWQRAFGVGVRFHQLPASIAREGVSPADILVRANGVRVHTPAQWSATASLNEGANVRLEFMREASIEPIIITVPSGELRAAHLDSSAAVDRAHPARAMGFYKHYLPFSYLVTIVSLLAFGMALVSRGPSKWLFSAICAVLVACLAATVTRSAMAFVILGAVVAVWRVADRKLRSATIAIAAVALVAASLWIEHERGLGWISAADAGTQYRLTIWRDGLQLISQHPAVGIGFDAVFRDPGHWNIEAFHHFPLVAHFHSTLIEYAVDGGLPTAAAWLWLLAAFFFMLLRLMGMQTTRIQLARGETTRTARQLVRFGATARVGVAGLRTEDYPLLHGIVLGIFAALIAFFGISLVQYVGADPAIMTIFWFTVGLAIAIDQLTRTHAPLTARDQ